MSLQFMILSGTVSIIVVLILVGYIRELSLLRKEIHEAYERKVEFYAVSLWEELLKKLENIEQFSTSELTIEKNTEIQRELGALERGACNVASYPSRTVAICHSLDHVIWLLGENQISKKDIIKKVEHIRGYIKELQDMYEVRMPSRNKLLCAVEENIDFVKRYNSGIAIIESM